MEGKELKRIVISEAQLEENLRMAAYLLEKGCQLTLITEDSKITNSFFADLSAEQQQRCYVICLDSYTESRVSEATDQLIQLMAGLDVFINGLPGTNEAELLRSSPDSFGQEISTDFNKLFLLNREIVRYMVRQKCGNIIFTMLDDILYYADYPASPVKNQGRLSLMKSLAKELTPFNIRVNSLSFGIYDRDFTSAEKKVMQKRLEICALKPPIPKWQDLLPALDALINPSFQYMTGQKYSAGIGSSNS